MAITDPLPTVGGDDGVWGTKLNTVIEDLITALDGLSGDSGAIVGPQGPKGDTGAAGSQGPKGDTGAIGPAGSGVNIKGLLAVVGSLPATGNFGDAWLVGTTSASNLYVWDIVGLQWTNVGTIQGPAGSNGTNGSNGAAGATGATGATGAAGATGATGAAGAIGALFSVYNGSTFATPGTTPKIFVAPTATDPATNGQTVHDGDLWFKTA